MRRLCVTRSSAAFEAEYGPPSGSALRPAIEPTLTMRPSDRRSYGDTGGPRKGGRELYIPRLAKKELRAVRALEAALRKRRRPAPGVGVY